MSDGLLHVDGTVDGGDPPPFGEGLAADAALRTRRDGGRRGDDAPHAPLLNPTTEPTTEFVGASLNDGIVRHPRDAAFRR
ncbi:hypothetical protein [Paludisphaera soli]|uniref:hypothetical protein n=1 Tax=Paludisphaera soli TaxID=2712865 RepID=UPI0013E9D14B|nr:hypothetical protein [Paludisphaera soli]